MILKNERKIVEKAYIEKDIDAFTAIEQHLQKWVKETDESYAKTQAKHLLTFVSGRGSKYQFAEFKQWMEKVIEIANENK